MNSITVTNITMDNKIKPADNKVKIIVKKSKIVIKKSNKTIETNELTDQAKQIEPNKLIDPDKSVEISKSDEQDQVALYLKSLTAQEKQTLDIATSHLGTSFNMKKSIGFLNWKSKQS